MMDTPKVENDVKEQPESILTEDSIKQHLLNIAPRRYKEEAENIINFLKNHTDILGWNSNGEIIYKGTLLPETNIVKLIDDVLRKRKKSPIGSKTFYNALNEINLPHNYVINKKVFSKNIMHTNMNDNSWLSL